MRKALSIALVLVLGLSASAWAKPVDVSKSLDKFKYLELNGKPTSDYVGRATGGVFNSSAAGTTWYGGTHWNGTSMRWEANINDVWTFDSGIGSTIIAPGMTGADYPNVQGNATPAPNKYKREGLHAIMEGWVGFDNTYSELTYLRLLSSADARWNGTPLVGAAHAYVPNLLSGAYSWYCGAFPDEANQLCFSAGGGYGNSWRLCMGKDVNSTNGGSVTLSFNMVWQSEQDYDFTTVEVDTGGAGSASDVVVAAAYDAVGSGLQTLTLSPQLEVRSTPGPMQMRFCFTSDGAWSDEDGLNPTYQGAFSIDDVGMTGAVNDGPYNFDDNAGHGWGYLTPAEGVGGEWSNLALIDDLPPYLTPCTCAIADSVLVFEDLLANGHGDQQDNLAASPWIVLQPGADGPGKFVETHIYAELPLLNYVFVQFNTQYYPLKCEKTGLDLVSPWRSDGFIYYFGGVPQCTTPGAIPTRIDFGSRIDPGATEIRMALGVISLCASQSDCSDVSNHTPVFDQAALGVFGEGGAPLIGITDVNVPQDNFPANGTLRLDAPARYDAGNVANESSPEVNSVLGDTLVVNGATGGAAVYVDLAVAPGPFINNSDLTAFYSRLSFDTNANGRAFYTARMDTAERAGAGAAAGNWMTAYHEDDSHFQGTPGDDAQFDPNDLGPYSSATEAGRLLNDIFPDDLFTPGTRVEVFFRTAFLDTNGVPQAPWYVLPDTGLVAGGNYFEYEALPSSASSDTSWNCVLYVDHFDGRGAQPYIEDALGAALGYGGNNFEGTNWDRWDVRAPSSQQCSFGRPLGSEFGASVIQTLGYDAIVWNSGNLNAFCLVKEDADVIIPFLTLLDFPGNSFYGSGDGLANAMTGESATEPSSLLLLNTVMGANRKTGCNTFRDAGCPTGSDPQDTTACVAIDPVGGLGPVANELGRAGSHYGQGNGCPQQRSFDVLDTFTPINGSSAGDENYQGDLKAASYASVAASSPGGVGVPTYATLIDGVSVHYRRDTDTPCVFNTGSNTVTAVHERIAEALHWMGHDVATVCQDPTASTAAQPPKIGPTYRTTLANFAPNPLLAGAKGKITFTMAKEGPANIDIFDVNGRLVKTVFDGVAQAGPNEANWNGTDFTGRDVASGVYFYRLRADQKDLSKKMVVVRNGGN